MRRTYLENGRRTSAAKVGVSTLALSVALLGLATSAAAQTAPKSAPAADQASDANAEDIIVTGTLIHGTAPVGSNSITLGQDKIAESGAISSNELLATLPQVTNYFNSVPSADLAIAVNQLQIMRPNIRNISPTNAASSGTLVLVDGHRIASVGVSQASVDPDVIPTGAIERVEIVTEGGSATYGADAVAGVINFITRKKFDGLRVSGHYGFADKYWQYDASATAGKDWGTGSLWASYTYTKNRALFGGDRDFIHRLDYTTQPYRGASRQCNLPNINIATSLPAAFGGGLVSNQTYAYTPGATSASLVANTANTCDALTNAAVVPAVERHGGIIGLTQDLSATTHFTARAFYSRRYTLATAPALGTVTLSPANPFAIGPAGASLGPATCFGVPNFCTNSETVDFSFAPLLGNASSRQSTLTEEWGANAEFTQKLAGSWQLRGLFNYSASNSSFELTNPNVTLLNAAGAGTTTSTAFNPFNLALTNPSLIAGILNNEIAGQAKDTLIDFRAIADGSLFSLPGGDVKVAVGYEHIIDEYQQRNVGGGVIGLINNTPYNNYNRYVNAVFGEINAPVFGGNSGPSLVLSASGRYDFYSDFGNTFNPKFGATFKPVRWLSIRGNYGTSFTAPTPLDQLGSQANTISSFPFVAFVRPGDTPANGSYTVALFGSTPNLQPQTATTWSVGFDASPPIAPGLRMSFNYYNVKFKNILATPSPNNTIFANFPAAIQSNPAGVSVAQLQAFALLGLNGATTINPLIAANTPVYELVDFRTGNFGVLKVGGLDATLNYQHQTSFGSFDVGANANYLLQRDSQVSATSATVDQLALDNGTRFYLTASAGVDVGKLRAEATLNHTGGYAITPTVSVPVQSKIGSFNVVNLFFKYDFKSESRIFRDLSLTLNVNNVLDQDPPVSFQTNISNNGYANGFTLGRLFQLGISKKF